MEFRLRSLVPAALAAMVAGAALLGWHLEIDWARRWRAGWPAIRPIAAQSALWLSLGYLIFSFRKPPTWSRYVETFFGWMGLIAIFVAGVVMMMRLREGPHRFGLIHPARLGGEDTGYPSVGAIVGFSVLGLCLIAARYNRRMTKLRACGHAAALIIALVALVGYALHQPLLYYYIPRNSTAIALNSAVCMALLGLCGLSCDRHQWLWLKKRKEMRARCGS